MKAPSIRARLARALLGWSIAWSLAVALAVWLAADHEVKELLDDTLQAEAEVLGTLLASEELSVGRQAAGTVLSTPIGPSERFAWQVIGPGATLLLRSPHAPELPLQITSTSGFSRVADWHIFGTPLGSDGRMLYVAQTRAERLEAQGEVAASAVVAALAIGLVGHVWLRLRVRQELEPLQRLSDRLARHEPLEKDATLGPAERRELEPVQAAIDELGHRLARRMAHERAFTAHAAHSLRTPLAGIDAQLAVALREAPLELRARLQRVRDAAGRLQRVVAALLALFRSGVELQRGEVDLASLLLRLPIDGLDLHLKTQASLRADDDLLAAALLNLLDNSLRYGAREVEVSVPRAGTLRLQDDGPGVPDARRRELQGALDAQAYEGSTGMGLMLADLVARAHGGALVLPEVERGFAVELRLG